MVRFISTCKLKTEFFASIYLTHSKRHVFFALRKAFGDVGNEQIRSVNVSSEGYLSIHTMQMAFAKRRNDGSFFRCYMCGQFIRYHHLHIFNAPKTIDQLPKATNRKNVNRPLTAHLNSWAYCCNCSRISCVFWIKFTSESSDRNRYEKESITISRIWRNRWYLLIRKRQVCIKMKQWIAAYRRCIREQIFQPVDSRQ